MSNKANILAAWELRPVEAGAPIKADQLETMLASEKLSWVHLGASESSKSWLIDTASYLDSIIVDALFADETRPRMLEFNEGTLIILRGLNHNEGEDIEDMVSLRIWVDQFRIITVEKRNTGIVDEMTKLLSNHNCPRSAGEFIAKLSHLLIKKIEPAIFSLEEAIDQVEENALDGPDINLRLIIVDIRKKITFFRRYLSPQREVFLSFRTIEQKWLSRIHKRHLNESSDRIQRYLEELDLIRERAKIINDEINHVASSALNKNLYLLSIITTIFLPLSFLTGLFGINVGGIPGATSSSGFWLFCLGLGVVFIVVIYLLKKVVDLK